MKKCFKCKIEKIESDFFKDKYRKDGLCSYCKSCKGIYSEKWRIKERNQKRKVRKQNKEDLLKKITKICSKCGEEKSKKKFSKGKFYMDGLSSYCKTCSSEYNKKRYNPTRTYQRVIKARKEKPEIINLMNNKRRTRCNNTDITITWLKEQRENTKNCSLCGVEMNKIRYDFASKSLDHIKQICLGGTHTKNNVRYICLLCNLKRPKRVIN